MQVRCKKHNEFMHEYLEGDRIIPYCATCIALKRAADYKMLREKINNRKKTTSEIIDRIFKGISTIIAGVIVMGILVWVVGLFGGAIVFLVGSFLLKWLGYDEKILTDNSIEIYVITGLVLMLFSVISTILSIRKDKRNTKEITDVDLLEKEKKTIENLISYHQKRVNDYKEQLHVQYRYKTADIDQIDKLNGIEFEDFMASFFIQIGYKVLMTPATGDEGLDLIIERDSLRIGVQCKCYTGKISVSAVQEAYAGKDMYDCDEALVVTNSYFTAPAKRMAEKLNVALWDRETLVAELLEIQTPDLSWNDFIKEYYDLTKVNQVTI